MQSRLIREECPWLIHGFSTRTGGVSAGRFSSLNLGLHVEDDPGAVLRNRTRFVSSLLEAGGASSGGMFDRRIVAAEQIHGGVVAAAHDDDAGAGALERHTTIPGADGLATAAVGLPLLLLFADCVPVLLADRQNRVVSIVHAGWKGTAAGIVRNAVSLLAGRYGSHPADLLAWLGPSIGGCCYEVDLPVLQAVSMASWQHRSGAGGPGVKPGERVKLDLKAANRAQLEDCGLNRRRIEVAEDCTTCDIDRFFSYRRDGQTGRMGLCATIRGGSSSVDSMDG